MSPIAKFAYWTAAGFIFLSPLAGVLLHEMPSRFQVWGMYSIAYPACTMKFSSPEGDDPEFHLATMKLLNQGMDRPANSRIIIRNEDAAVRLLEGYCFLSVTKHRKARVNIQCFDHDRWQTSAHSGEVVCKE